MTECRPQNLSDCIAYCNNGEEIFTEGSNGSEMYVVHSGKVEISRETSRGKQVLAIIEKGGFFGEMAILSDTSRTATATAIEPTILIRSNKDAMVERVQKNPAFALELLIGLSARLMSTTTTLMEKISEVERHNDRSIEYALSVASRK